MMKSSFAKIYVFTLAFFVTFFLHAQESAQNDLQLKLLDHEYWWGGAVTQGTQMPYAEKDISVNLIGNNHGNQYAPLLHSSKGRYIWCDQPFRFEFKDQTLSLSAPKQKILFGKSGEQLKTAFLFASKKFFPPSEKTPDLHLISAPQYNTWIELLKNQNQRDILKYAHAIIENGFPPGVLMVDGGWQEDYGLWNFHTARFTDPIAMIQELHSMGFKVMLWVCPFVSPDSSVYRDLKTKDAFFMDRPHDPAIVTWWSGKSAMLDLSNPYSMNWFVGQLKRLQQNYGVDGFKFDAGDTIFYSKKHLAHQKCSPDDHTTYFAKIGLDFPLNEYRACWKMAGQPLVQRLRDKNHNWRDVAKLIPDQIAAGLIGHPFVCPDMIGGGEFQSFRNKKKLDQDIIVRSAQIHALSPMMQFSVAPWRVLDKEHLQAVKKAVEIRMKFTPLLLQLAKKSAKTGEPILRPLVYNYPNGGYECVQDQFMIGETLLVAPQTKKENSRTVLLPTGKWLSDNGKVLEGPRQLTIDTPLDRIPYFTKE